MKFIFVFMICSVSLATLGQDMNLNIKRSAFAKLRESDQLIYLNELEFKQKKDNRIINLTKASDREYVEAVYGIIISRAQVKFTFLDSKKNKEIYVNGINLGKIDKNGNLEARSYAFPIGANKMLVKDSNKDEFSREIAIHEDGEFKCNYISEIICESI